MTRTTTWPSAWRPIEQVHQPLADDHRIGTRFGRGVGLKLIDDPVGEQRLGLIGAHLENHTARDRGEESGQKGRLPGPSVRLDVDDLRATGPGSSQCLLEDAQLTLAADEADRTGHRPSQSGLVGTSHRPDGMAARQ